MDPCHKVNDKQTKKNNDLEKVENEIIRPSDQKGTPGDI